jgi:hypothetical protein
MDGESRGEHHEAEDEHQTGTEAVIHVNAAIAGRRQ